MNLHRCFCFQIFAPLPFTKAWRLDTICSLAANKYQKNKCLGIEVETRDCISKKGSMEKSLPLKCETKLWPNVLKCVTNRLRKTRTVTAALRFPIYKELWAGMVLLSTLTFGTLSGFVLNPAEDLHHWKLDPSGMFYTKSDYHAFFIGSFTFEPWKRLWKPWAPGKNCCWTADRLEKRGSSSSWSVYPLWPGGWDNTAHPHHMCLCSAILVSNSAAFEPRLSGP